MPDAWLATRFSTLRPNISQSKPVRTPQFALPNNAGLSVSGTSFTLTPALAQLNSGNGLLYRLFLVDSGLPSSVPPSLQSYEIAADGTLSRCNVSSNGPIHGMGSNNAGIATPVNGSIALAGAGRITGDGQVYYFVGSVSTNIPHLYMYTEPSSCYCTGSMACPSGEVANPADLGAFGGTNTVSTYMTPWVDIAPTDSVIVVNRVGEVYSSDGSSSVSLNVSMGDLQHLHDNSLNISNSAPIMLRTNDDANTVLWVSEDSSRLLRIVGRNASHRFDGNSTVTALDVCRTNPAFDRMGSNLHCDPTYSSYVPSPPFADVSHNNIFVSVQNLIVGVAPDDGYLGPFAIEGVEGTWDDRNTVSAPTIDVFRGRVYVAVTSSVYGNHFMPPDSTTSRLYKLIYNSAGNGSNMITADTAHVLSGTVVANTAPMVNPLMSNGNGVFIGTNTSLLQPTPSFQRTNDSAGLGLGNFVYQSNDLSNDATTGVISDGTFAYVATGTSIAQAGVLGAGDVCSPSAAAACFSNYCPSNTCQDPPSKVVFATGGLYSVGSYSGNNTSTGFNSVAHADVICQGLADRANLKPGSTFKAWLSDSLGHSPGANFVQSAGPYVLTSGAKVANSYSDLVANGARNMIGTNETGDAFITSAYQEIEHTVWTGTNSDGTAATNNCQNWTSNAASPNVGLAGYIGFQSLWTDGGVSFACQQSFRLYCFEQ